MRDEQQWLASRLGTPSVVPTYYPEKQHPAARRIISAAIGFMLVVGILVGGLFYLKKHPMVVQREVTRVLPQSGASPSAYAYMMRSSRRERARSVHADAASVPAGSGTVTIETQGFSLSSDEFIAEVIDGDRHYFIRFHRVPPVVVATKDPSTVAVAPVSAPADSGAAESVYLSRNGWWNLSRVQQSPPPQTNGVAATVVLDVFLTPDGHVDHAEVVSGPAQMATAAVQAVSNWHYAPPSAGAPAQKRVVVNFSVAAQ